jgi:general secretion pathway protein E/type IV pilus assembly protein PilB
VRIGERLIQMGLISKDQLEIALREQAKSKKLLGNVLVSMSFITESALGEVLAESAGAEKFDPKATMLDTHLLSLIPRDVCARHKVIPVSQEGMNVRIAMVDVYNVLALDQVRRHLDKNAKIVPLYATESEISDMIDRYYNYEMSIDGILREIETGIREKSQLDGREEGYVNPTVRLCNALLVDAIKQGVSDIHFEPEGSFLRLRYRIDGALHQIRSFHRDYWPAMLVRLKIMAGMNIAETRNPQDGRISLTALGRDVDFRVATQPTVHGENVVLRILDKSKALVPLTDLGFSDHNLGLLKKCILRPEGIIVVTGPTGSGKTTTLYSILSFINSIDVNIMTLEDPVEYQLPMIRQTNVREGSIDFQSGIKSLMRQDPDIIFVGEVRDEETAIMAVRAALTGHQVYTTLHTNDALGAIPRLGDIGVPAHLLAGSLICTIAQRLARKLCDNCKKPRQANGDECKLLLADPAKPPVVYDAVGCEKCGYKGYKGRTAIVEILRIDKGLDELIATHATRNQMFEYAVEHGFVTMVQDGISKVLQGEIDLPELINTVDLTDRL